ncbi:GNAT family N-acetyltransferase [Kribbella sp. NPDC056951]|uniref:GNAT family N-acetyltransferase n=1 Tax=Kribbella sp. NPDC056951 TaxID=3345978 RepID=UPI003644459C
MGLTERLELGEAEMYWVLSQCPPDVVELLGLKVQRFGRGVVLALSNDPTQYWSQAHGLGFDRPIGSALIGEVIDFARGAGGDVMNFHLAPEVLPDDWAQICAEHGLTSGGTLMKTVRDASPVKPVETDLRIGPIGPDDAATWTAIQIEGFEMPDEDGSQSALFHSFTQVPEVTAYGAWDGDTMVAGAALCVVGDLAELVSDATLPSYRGRGAQSALQARRLEDAYAAGCRWASSETEKPGPDEHNSSLANMERQSLQLAYERPIYTWHA